MRTMDFLNYTQRPFTNVTVRRGYKWANLKVGEMIMLSDNGNPIEGATIRQILVKKFSDIKTEDIKREHDSYCTTRNHLFRAMRVAYPDFSMDEVVTIVTYVIQK